MPKVSELEEEVVQSLRGRLMNEGKELDADLQMKWMPVHPLSEWAKEIEPEAQRDSGVQMYFEQRGLIAALYADEIYLLVWDSKDKCLDSRTPEWNIRAQLYEDDYSQSSGVRFDLNLPGTKAMGDLTEHNHDAHMSIIIEGHILSAPMIRGRITSTGVITGGRSGFINAEKMQLLRVIQGTGTP